jgi:hypothetical protein
MALEHLHVDAALLQQSAYYRITWPQDSTAVEKIGET